MSAHLHDLSRVAIAIGIAAAVTWVGVLLLSLVPRPARALLLPAAPALGVCTLVVVFHWTGLFVGTDVAAPALVVVVVVATVVTLIWRRDRLTSGRSAALLLVVGLGLGVPAVLVAMQPTFSVDTGDAIHPSGNHDAFWYASVSTWLENHRANETPKLGPAPAPDLDPRGFAPMEQARTFSMRIGEPMLHAAATSLTGLEMTETWYPIQAAWLFVLPGAWIAFALLRGLGATGGALAGVGCSLASLMTFQVFNQNAGSVLGLAVMPLAVGITLAVLDGTVPLRFGAPLAAVSLTGLAGIYTELLPLVFIGVAAALIGAKLSWAARLRIVGTVVGLSLVFGPLVWTNAIRGLTDRAGVISDTPLRRFWTSDVPTLLARLLGLTGVDELHGWTLPLVAAALLVLAGLVFAVREPKLRYLTAGFIVTAAVIWIARGRSGDYYLTERLGTIVGPVLVAFSALGWTQFVRSLRPSTARAVLYGVGAVGVVGAVLLLLGNIRTSLDYVDNRQQQAVFSVSYDVDQAVSWGRQYGGAEGDALNVLTDSYIDRLWLAQQLVDRPLTSYPYLTGDYFFAWSYVDRQPRRYLLASRDILTTFPPGSIVEANAQYVLYDTSRAAGVAISPTTNWFEGEGTRDDHIQWMSNDGDVVVMRWSPTEPVQVELKSVPTLERVGVDVVGEGEEDLGSLVVTSTSTWHPLDLPDGYVAYVRFDNAPSAVPPGNGDARPLSVGLQDVTAG